jgi:hypothetical protein
LQVFRGSQVREGLPLSAITMSSRPIFAKLSDPRFVIEQLAGAAHGLDCGGRGVCDHIPERSRALQRGLPRHEQRAQARGEVSHVWPEFLPGGQAMLFAISVMAGPDHTTLPQGHTHFGDEPVAIDRR